MKKITFFTLFTITILICFNTFLSIAQIPTFTIKYADPNYFCQEVSEKGDTLYIWHLKKDLKRGKYIAITRCSNDIDTVLIGTFIRDGVKHGQWIEWAGKMCISSIDNGKYIGEPEIEEITIYKNGKIRKKTSFHISPNTPHIENTYSKNKKRFSYWIGERVWHEEGYLRWEKKMKTKGKMRHRDYHPNGKVWGKGQLVQDSTFRKAWTYFHPNGKRMAKGKFLSIENIYYYTGIRIPKGEWKYWDKMGQLIAIIYFKEGEIVDFQKFQNKPIPLPEIERMLQDITKDQ